MLPFKLAWRLARRLAAAWAARPGPPPDPARAWADVEDCLARVRHADRLLRLAVAKGWAAVAPRLAAESAARLDDLARAVDGLRDAVLPPPAAPGPADWVAEVRQLEAEFGAVEVRWADRVVRATTGPVVLRGVDLGPFAVDFHWDRRADRGAARCFAVVALDPHPAAGREEVVHPHVDGTTLCAGDAAGPLDRAAADGRLADAFVLVRAVLATYNPASPYVPLDEWAGVACGDCGRRADPDDATACGGCGDDLCDGCAAACAVCLQTRCGGCLDPCRVCRAECCPGCLEECGDGGSACPGCVAPCGGCGTRTPTDDLTAAGRLCPACDQPDEEESDEDDAADEAPGPVGAGGDAP